MDFNGMPFAYSPLLSPLDSLFMTFSTDNLTPYPYAPAPMLDEDYVQFLDPALARAYNERLMASFPIAYYNPTLPQSQVAPLNESHLKGPEESTHALDRPDSHSLENSLLATVGEPSGSASVSSRRGKVRKEQKTCDAKPDDRIRRPRNSFIIFLNKYSAGNNSRRKCMRGLAREAGAAWRQLDSVVKEKYAREADEEKRLHKLRYPTYKYSPRTASKTKGRSGEARKA